MKILINKKRILIPIIILIVCLILLLCNNLYKKYSLKKSISDIASNFYEEVYYKTIESLDTKEDILKSVAETGLTFELKMIIDNNNHDYDYCDKEKTKVIIFPTSPYEKKSYTKKVEINCKKH